MNKNSIDHFKIIFSLSTKIIQTKNEIKINKIKVDIWY